MVGSVVQIDMMRIELGTTGSKRHLLFGKKSMHTWARVCAFNALAIKAQETM